MRLPLRQEKAWLSMLWPFLLFMSELPITVSTEDMRQVRAWRQASRKQGMGAARLRPKLQVPSGWEGGSESIGAMEGTKSDLGRKKRVSRSTVRRLIRITRSLPQLTENPGLTTPEH